MNLQDDQHRVHSNLRWTVVGLTVLVYWRTSSNAFINYDDAGFVFQNPHVYTGLTLANVKWAFTTLNGDVTSYQPLTWLTHQLDCQLFGLRPGFHHLTNLWLHIANTLLLFDLFQTLTQKPWRSALVAALFAVHPLHIETVASVSERKSLVCTFFWLLSTLAYVHYTGNRSIRNYLLIVLSYSAALLSKPIAVSLPFTLLLLQFWPLDGWNLLQAQGSDERRFKRQWLRGKIVVSVLSRMPKDKLFRETVPLFLMSFAACWLTFWR